MYLLLPKMKSKSQMICPYKPNTPFWSGSLHSLKHEMPGINLSVCKACYYNGMRAYISFTAYFIQIMGINVFQNKHINEINSVMNFSQCTELTACLPITNAVGIHCAIGSTV